MGDAAHTKGLRRTFIVPSIKAFDHYDFTRAKISCSFTWLVAKAFGSDVVPEELADPFYRDQYSQEHLKPPVASLLLSAELYCRAGSLILRSDAVKPLLGHNAVIQALAQKGLYVTDQDRLVTERDLTSTPIRMGQATESTGPDSEASPAQNHLATKEIFGESLASKDTGKTFANTIKEEEASYKAASGIPVDGDPLAWWKSNECKYPHIAMMARRYLAVPGTSVPSERVFSMAGDIVTVKRSTLSPNNVDIRIF